MATLDIDLINSLLQRWVLDGGPVMFLLVPCSFLALGGFLQMIIRLRRGRVAPRELRKQAAAASANSTTRANFLRALRADPRPLALVVRRAMQDQPDLDSVPDARAVEMQLEAAAIETADEMSEGLGLLSTLYTVAPLIGLLGTVLGLMTTFGVFASSTQHSIQDMSTGVKQHLVATVWGLGIAIASYAAAYYLQRRIIRYERHVLPDAGLDVIDQLFSATPPLAGAAGAPRAAVIEAMERGGKTVMSTTLLLDKEKLKAALAERHAEQEAPLGSLNAPDAISRELP